MGQLQLGEEPAETDVATSETAGANAQSGQQGSAQGTHDHTAAEAGAFSGVTHVAEDGTVKYFPANQLMNALWQVDDYDDGG